MKKLFITVFISFAFLLILAKPAAADISCTATVDPNSVQGDTTNSFSYSVKNDGSSDILWIKVSQPSTDFTFIAGTGYTPGWTNSISDSDITLTSGKLVSSDSISFTVQVNAKPVTASSANWIVQVSGDGGGASCGGSLGTEITAAPPAPTTGPSAPAISNIVVSDVISSSVKISWDTDIASDSRVDYGTTTGYGSSKTDSSSVTSHSISLDSLSANTTYHYNLTSSSSGASGQSGDNSFVTAVAGTTGTTQTGTTTTTTTTTTRTTAAATPTPIPDRTGPSMVLTTDFSKPFIEAPTIKGRASDISGVKTVDYSIDSGENWLPVDTLKTSGSTNVTFEFIPLGIEDGNYQIKIRSSDSKGNISVSRSYSLVIDRLPPRIGPILFSIGPQVIWPEEGMIMTLSGIDMQTVLSLVGGPINVDLTAVNTTDPNIPSLKLSFNKNSDNGLWFGDLNFDFPGIYKAKVYSVDGAENKIDKQIVTFLVLENGKVTDGKKPIKDAKISLYSLDPISKRFIIWDGTPYGVTNPQKTDKEGKYSLFIPPGTYYLNLQANRYKSLKTNIFSINQSLPITDNFILKRARFLSLGSWEIALPEFESSTADVSLSLPSFSQDASDNRSLLGKEIPDFRLSLEGKDVTNLSLRGKRTIITFLSIWSPLTSEQLGILDELAGNSEINIVVIIPQEKNSKVAVFRKKGGYKLPIIADPDGDLIEKLNLTNIPTHVFLDRKGIIQKVKTGFLNKGELLDNMID